MSSIESRPEAHWRWYHRAIGASDTVLPLVRRINFHDRDPIILQGRFAFNNAAAVVQSGRLPPFATIAGVRALSGQLTIPDRYRRELASAYRAIGVDPDPFTRPAPSIQLRIGRRYFTRDGMTVEITSPAQNGELNGLIVEPASGGCSTWLPDGRYLNTGMRHDNDLVYEAA